MLVEQFAERAWQFARSQIPRQESAHFWQQFIDQTFGQWPRLVDENELFSLSLDLI